MKSPRTSSILVALLAALLMHPSLAFAYIDPNAGGFLFQLLAPVFAAVLAAWFFLRRVIADAWHRLRQFITRKEDR